MIFMRPETYSIGIIDGKLRVRANDGNGSTVTSYSEKAIYGLIASFISRNYEVVKYSRSLSLRSGYSSLRIENYKETLKDYRLERLSKDIVVSIKRNGLIDKSEASKVSRKPNRAKSQSYKDAIIKTGMAILLMAEITTFMATYKNTNKTNISRTFFRDEPAIVEVIEKSAHPTLLGQVETKNKNFEIKEEDTVRYRFEDSAIEPEVPLIQIEKKDIDEGILAIEDRYDTPKAINARTQYYDIICKMAHRYGLDPELLMAMATQEKGVHTPKIDAGGGYGLMQIQYKVWIDDVVYCYKLNETTGEFEQHQIKVTKSALKDVESNIEIGAAILQSYLSKFKYNIPMAVQAYNQGPNAVAGIVKRYCADYGKDYKDVIRTPEDLGWLEYRNQIKGGDPLYLEKVNSWVENRDFTVINVHNYEDVAFRFSSDVKTI